MVKSILITIFYSYGIFSLFNFTFFMIRVFPLFYQVENEITIGVPWTYYRYRVYDDMLHIGWNVPNLILDIFLCIFIAVIFQVSKDILRSNSPSVARWIKR